MDDACQFKQIKGSVASWQLREFFTIGYNTLRILLKTLIFNGVSFDLQKQGMGVCM